MLAFDTQEKFVGVAGTQHVVVYSLEERNLGRAYTGSIDGDAYRQILDMQLVTEGMPSGKFKLLVAAQVSGITNIHVFDLNRPGGRMTIAYSKPPEKQAHLTVKVAADGKQAIFSNGFEHYIHDGGSQANFPWIKDKFIRWAVPEGDGFFIACSKEYDRDIDLLHSKRSKFHASVDRHLEPGLFKVYDMQVVTVKEGEDKGKRLLSVLCCVGDYLSLEVIDVDVAERPETGEGHVASYTYRFYNAYSFNWPYFAYASRFCDLFILNAFNPSFVQCYEMPKHTRHCAATFLTDTHDFFCVSETLDDHFEILHIDLDDPNPRLRSILKYSFEEVDSQAVEAFHCRGSSRKERVDLNEMLVVYLMHGTDLYYWVQGNSKLQLIDRDAKNLYYMSDNVLFYQHDPPVRGKN